MAGDVILEIAKIFGNVGQENISNYGANKLVELIKNCVNYKYAGQLIDEFYRVNIAKFISDRIYPEYIDKLLEKTQRGTLEIIKSSFDKIGYFQDKYRRVGYVIKKYCEKYSWNM